MTDHNPRPRSKENACDSAIMKTLAYGAVFSYPMSKHQIYTYLITKNKFEPDFFEKALKRLVKKSHIKSKDGKFYLPGIRPVSWYLRAKYSNELLAENKLAFTILRKIPWIKLLTITGAVSSYNATKDDDIDIFIISQKDRMWITRLFVYLLLSVINKYAKGENNKNKLCCNLFVDEEKMQWPENKQNLYIAYEIASVLPMIDRQNTYFRFLKKNEWLKNFFANFPIHNESSKLIEPKGSWFVDQLENLIRKAQIWYMRKKKTSEITTENLIHFNKNDHSSKILEEYKILLSKISFK